MNLEKVVKTRLILPEEFLVLLLGLGDPGFRWMFSEPDLLQKFYFSICDREKKMFHQFGERQFEKVLFRALLRNSSKLWMLICKSRKMLFLSVQTDDVKLTGKKRNIDPMWKVLKKDLDLDGPTSLLDHVYGLHSTGMRHQQRYWGQLQNYVCIQDLCRSKRKTILFRGAWRRHLPWSFDMEGHAKKFVEWCCELTNKKHQQMYKVTTPCLDDHQFKEYELEAVGELWKIYSQIVLTCLYLARFGGPNIQWTVIQFARAVTKWTRVCDKRLARLISYIHHTSQATMSYAHSTTVQVGLVRILSWKSWKLKIDLGGIWWKFGNHTFVVISWIFKKQTSVSHSSTESEKFLDVIQRRTAEQIAYFPAL